MTEFNTINTHNTGSINSSLHSSEFNELFQSKDTRDDQPYWLDCFPEIVGRSPKMLKVLETVYKISFSNSSVLINGESGTGKELIASAIHRLSPRASKKFVAINCSAIPETLLESELFGHEKGAFTGAATKRVGLFGQADGGTLFLDEIGDMPLRLQSKLLRVLQDKKFTPLGGQNIYCSDVRIIAATNINLDRAVSEGKFRLDLYYRLNVLPVYIPPLRERPEDIPDLLNKFLQNTNKLSGSGSCHFSSEALTILCQYPWPGNVRELQNLVERMSILSKNGTIGLDSLPDTYKQYSNHYKNMDLSISGGGLNKMETFNTSNTRTQANSSTGVNYNVGSSNQSTSNSKVDIANSPYTYLNECLNRSIQKVSSDKNTYDFSSIELPESGIDMVEYIEQLENYLTLQALNKTSNNKNQAAKLLGLNRTTLVERIKKRKLIPLQEPSKEL